MGITSVDGTIGPNSPTVSVILPVYNGADYVRFAIESVLAQTFRDFELIIVDDGSTDGTAQIVSSYGDNRIRYFKKDNGGVATAVNYGLRAAAGRYISWLSHDDVFLPTKLEMQVAAREKVGEPSVIYTDFQFINSTGAITEERRIGHHSPGETVRNLLVAGSISFAAYSLFYDKQCLEQVGLYDESQPFTQDADMLIRLARRFPLVGVPETLTQIRRHSAQWSAESRWAKEAHAHYLRWLERLPLKELFPENGATSSARARAKARIWLGDRYASNPVAPYIQLARQQYREAARESVTVVPLLIPKLARLLNNTMKQNRQFYRIGLRSAIARRLKAARQ